MRATSSSASSSGPTITSPSPSRRRSSSPACEPFPPPRRASSRAMQRRFYRRMALVFAAVMGLVIVGAFTVFWAVAGALGFARPEGQGFPGDHPGGLPFFVVPLVFIVIIVAL